jgi:chemotaxis methyl-accepting protein methylase
MNDEYRKKTGHGGIYYSKVPYSLFSLNELIEYNDYISENVSFKFKIKFKLKKIISFKKQNILKSKLEYFFGVVFSF